MAAESFLAFCRRRKIDWSRCIKNNQCFQYYWGIGTVPDHSVAFERSAGRMAGRAGPNIPVRWAPENLIFLLGGSSRANAYCEKHYYSMMD